MARKVKYDFNPFKLTGESAKGLGDKREQVLSEIADLVTNEIKTKAASQSSAVSKRGKWARLTKAYADSQKGGNRTADLELTSDMLDSLNTHKRSGNVLRTTVGEGEQKKADGHNNFTGNSTLPTRRFIPDSSDGETWNKKLISQMAEVIRRARDSEEE